MALLTPHLHQISGVVLDLGPGTGHLTRYYPADRITAIYGAEPNVDLHKAIRANVAAAAPSGRMKDKYRILTCGAEPASLVPALVDAGLLKSGDAATGVFDAIVALRVLCGIHRRQLRDTLETLYALLKPGGRLIIVEHVVNEWKFPLPGQRPADQGHRRDEKDATISPSRGGFLGRALQLLYKPLWEFFIACRIDAETADVLKSVGSRDGGWEKVDLKRRLEWAPLPWVGGVLIKKR